MSNGYSPEISDIWLTSPMLGISKLAPNDTSLTFFSLSLTSMKSHEPENLAYTIVRTAITMGQIWLVFL